MDGVEVLAFLSLLLLFAAAGLIIALERGRTSNGGTRFAAWLALTVLCLGGVFTVAFIAVNGLLFTLGREVAGVAFLGAVILLVLTPFATGFVVRRIHASR